MFCKKYTSLENSPRANIYLTLDIKHAKKVKLWRY